MSNKNESAKLDLIINKISNVYYLREPLWRRDFFDCREHNGLVLFLNGSITYNFGDFYVTASAGDVLMLPKSLPYSGVRNSGEDVVLIVINFLTENADDLVDFPIEIVTHVKEYDFYSSLFYNILDTWNENLIDSFINCKALLYKLIFNLVRESSLPAHKRIHSILEYINKNLSNEHLHLEDICNEFFISESQLRRDILKLTGFSPNEYIKDRRLNIARNLLVHNLKSIKEVSTLCGFSSQYYFSKCFKKQFKMSPSAYVKTVNKNIN